MILGTCFGHPLIFEGNNIAVGICLHHIHRGVVESHRFARLILEMQLSHRPASHEGASQKGLLSNSRGCCGAVTRALWTIYDNLLNDGQIRMTSLLGCQLLYYCLFETNLVILFFDTSFWWSIDVETCFWYGKKQESGREHVPSSAFFIRPNELIVRHASIPPHGVGIAGTLVVLQGIGQRGGVAPEREVV